MCLGLGCFLLSLSSLSSSFFFFSPLFPLLLGPIEEEKEQERGVGARGHRGGTDAGQPFMLKSREKAVQRLTELPKQRGGLPLDYLEPETDWEARQSVPGARGERRARAF